jgi:hypothetical protein
MRGGVHLHFEVRPTREVPVMMKTTPMVWHVASS